MHDSKSFKSTPVHSRIRVPRHYHRQPVISRLISRYGLTVNIKAASLAVDSDRDGWFDIELQGNPEQLINSLSYLQRCGVDLMQVGIVDNLEFSQNSYTLPKPVSKSIKRESATLTTQVQQEILPTQTNRVRLQLCIFQNYHRKPIISELVSRYQITVNIISALLKPDVEGDGWFDLDLWGTTQQLFSSVSYLQELGLPLSLDSSLYGTFDLIE
jgi:NIL domain